MISCIVLTRNRLRNLKECVRSIESNTNGKHEIIVVDNGSSDGTKEWLDRSNIKHIESDNSLGVCARNLGFDMANGDYVAQIDDDVVVHKGWDGVLSGMITGDVGAVGVQGAYVCKDWSNFNEGGVNVGDYCDVLTGFCWMWKNGPYRYDESFAPFWHEETELQLRMPFRKKRSPMVCTHNCQRNMNAIDWELHNKNLEKVRQLYMGKYVSERDK